MRALIQRVTWARVRVAERMVGEIAAGMLILLGVGKGDTRVQVAQLARKIVDLRIFADAQGKRNCSLLEAAGECLVVSQFTLYADCSKGRRPFYGDAEAPDIARDLCDAFALELTALGVGTVQTGEFGADMAVELCNDGPVTIWLDTSG